MTDNLLACPFCGGEAHMSASSDGYGVECWNRRCIDMQLEQIPTEAEAVAAWNTRAERTCKREKHGTKMDGSPRLRCSLCGYGIGDKRWSYCPNCGARVVEVVS